MKVRVIAKTYLEAPIGAILEVDKCDDGLCSDYYEVSGKELLRAGTPTISNDDYIYLIALEDVEAV